MKGVCDAAPAKDAMVEGGSLMARAVGQAVVPSIAMLAASSLARQVAGWRVGAHGVGWAGLKEGSNKMTALSINSEISFPCAAAK
jgi:hypothetical protein